MSEIGNMNSELKAFKQERKVMPEILKQHQQKIAKDLLEGNMGNSMNEAFSGNGHFKIPLRYRLRYNFKKIINNLLNTF